MMMLVSFQFFNVNHYRMLFSHLFHMGESTCIISLFFFFGQVYCAGRIYPQGAQYVHTGRDSEV